MWIHCQKSGIAAKVRVHQAVLDRILCLTRQTKGKYYFQETPYSSRLEAADGNCAKRDDYYGLLLTTGKSSYSHIIHRNTPLTYTILHSCCTSLCHLRMHQKKGGLYSLCQRLSNHGLWQSRIFLERLRQRIVDGQALKT